MNKFNPIDSNRLLYPNLVEELLNYSNEIADTFYERKVFRIWMKCKRFKKYALADKIKDKYPQYFLIKSDALQAFALSMTISNKLKK